jgi:tetratricopeptide (TPR) repeat protein
LAIARKEFEYNPGRIYQELGIEHTILSENADANDYYDSAMALAVDNKVLQAQLYNNRAILYTYEEKFDKALESQLKGLELNEELNDTDGIMRSYAGMSWIYKATNDIDKSLEYEKKSYDLAVELKDETSQYTILGNIVSTLEKIRRYEEAYQKNWKVINYFEKKSPGSIVIGNNYYNMTRIYNNLGRWDSAYYYGEKAKKIFIDRGATRELAYTLSHVGRAAMGLGKIAEAEAAGMRSYEMNKELGRIDELEDAVFTLVKVYAYKHDIGRMDRFQHELEMLGDSISKIGQAKAVAEIRTRYETEQKDHENETLRNQAELQRIRLNQSTYVGVSSLVGAALLALVAITLYQKNQQRKRFNKVLQTENEKLKVEMLVAQLNQLKDQINPHFLFNSLATLQSMAQENDPKTGLFVQKLSEVYRYILQTNSDNLVSLQEELKVAEAYMFMLNARFENAMITSIRIDDALLSRKLPPFSLQLLVENAIKHNSATQANPLRIEIKASGDEVVVRNNLQPKRSVVDSTKVGLANLQKRFSLLGSKTVSIERGDDHFTVRLPLYQ